MSKTLTSLATISILILVPLGAVAQLGGVVSATDQFEYSFSTETEKEIVENWLDVSYLFGSFRTGIMLNSQQPSEEGFRSNTIRHRFFEFSSGPFDLRVGHFFGLFGRGLIFASYEDRLVRVDTSLDGIIVSADHGRLQGTIFSGAYDAVAKDIRAMDLMFDLGKSWSVGGTALTYDTETAPVTNEKINRELVTSGRLTKFLSWSDLYVEYGWKKGYDFENSMDNEYQSGHAFYGSFNLFKGPAGLSLEAKDYWRYAVLPRTDGKPPLNNPPSTTREQIYTLIGRDSHQIDPDDEVGGQAELTLTGPAKWTLIANANRTENHDGVVLFEEVYAHLLKEQVGPFRLLGASNYQDVRYEDKGIHDTVIGDITWFIYVVLSVDLVVEYQHTRSGTTTLPDGILDLGTYETLFFILEYAFAPKWTFAGILETDNKYPSQRTFGEKEGPFPAFNVSYTSPFGSTLSLWAGKRQAGQVCVGGVCKNEPAFEGVELFGIIRF